MIYYLAWCKYLNEDHKPVYGKRIFTDTHSLYSAVGRWRTNGYDAGYFAIIGGKIPKSWQRYCFDIS